jgi:hypothetical protein
MPHTASEEMFIKTQVEEALSNAGVVSNSPLKAVLLRDAEIETTSRTAAVRIRDEHGRLLSLEEKLGEMKESFMFRHHFPKGKPVVPANDLLATREAFGEIASGRVRVE